MLGRNLLRINCYPAGSVKAGYGHFNNQRCFLVAFGTILYLFKDIERGDAYLKSGNTQLIIWACLLICITLLFIGIYRYDKKMMVPLAGLIFQYVPWIAVPRIAFIYHYFSIVTVFNTVNCLCH